MKAKAMRASKQPSKYGGFFFYIFFKDTAGGSWRSCIGPAYLNYKKSTARGNHTWPKVLELLEAKEQVWLDGLVIKNAAERVIDADSPFKIESILKHSPADPGIDEAERRKVAKAMIKQIRLWAGV